jgi:integrase/recombinase XerD
VIPKEAAQVNKQVNLTKRVKTSDGLRYCPTVLAANGRVKPDFVLIDGKEERHTEGAYYLEWREGTTRVRRSVGRSAADAGAERHRKQAELNAINNGIALVSSDARDVKRSLRTTSAEYLEEVQLRMKPRSYAAYNTAPGYFQECCSKICLEDVSRKDLLGFSAFLRDA